MKVLKSQRVAGNSDVAVDDDVLIDDDQRDHGDDAARELGEPEDSPGDAEPPTPNDDAGDKRQRRRLRPSNWTSAVTYVVLPAVALLLAIGAGYLKWREVSLQQDQVAGTESVKAASDGTVALLSYRPDTVDKDLNAARERLTGQFRDSYASLIKDVVIPGSQQKQVAATASVPAAASVSASDSHAVVLLFVDQTISVGKDTPTSTASTVRVTLDRVDGHWLISQFDPV
jgi:Mce-associated membrane protein